MVFLTKNQTFIDEKDCHQISSLIFKKTYLKEAVIKRSFLMNSLKKVFLKFSKIPGGFKGDPPGKENENSPINELKMRTKMPGKLISKLRKQNSFSAEYNPSLMSGGQRLGDGPGDPPSEEDPPSEKDPPSKKNPPPIDPPDTLIILLLQFYRSEFGLINEFLPGFNWDLFVFRLRPDDREFLLRLLKIYENDPSKVREEKQANILNRISLILQEINVKDGSAGNIKIKINIEKHTEKNCLVAK